MLLDFSYVFALNGLVEFLAVLKIHILAGLLAC
jgi:hypothetical protein